MGRGGPDRRQRREALKGYRGGEGEFISILYTNDLSSTFVLVCLRCRVGIYHRGRHCQNRPCRCTVSEGSRDCWRSYAMPHLAALASLSLDWPISA